MNALEKYNFESLMEFDRLPSDKKEEILNQLGPLDDCLSIMKNHGADDYLLTHAPKDLHVLMFIIAKKETKIGNGNNPLIKDLFTHFMSDKSTGGIA